MLRAVGDGGRIIPYAIGVSPSTIQRPIGEFHAAIADRPGTLNLVKMIRGGIAPEPRVFAAFWPLLNRVVEDVQREQWEPSGAEALVEQVKRACIAKASIRFEKVVLSATNVQRGSTVDMDYVVSVASDAHGLDAWLGASVKIGDAKFVFNSHQDEPVVLRAGRKSYARRFSVPPEMKPGKYTMNAEVWLGPISDSDNSCPLASLWPIPDQLIVS